TDERIVEGILSIARGMDVKTVAEFVGDTDCLGVLKTMGVDFAQGFYLGRPTPLVELIAEFRAESDGTQLRRAS
ncbi:MAG: EAL domain-containing protein, partial [Solirubrobacteraceae bacterium]|nr:EAL domain-containing protein [Solirubrobacteraceae bacterium]